MTAPQTAPRKPRAGDEIELSIDGFDLRGRGTAREREFHYAVRRAIPGSRVRARVLRRRGSSVEAIALETLDRGPHATAPICAHFGACGGCSFQDLAYAAQLEGLRTLVVKSLESKGLLESGLEVEDVIGAPATARYRNKTEFSFSNRRWIAPDEPENAPSEFALGFHAPALFSKVIDVGSCAIQSSAADAIVSSARTLALERAIPPWDVKAHTGLLRYLVLRVSGSTGEILVNLVTSSESREIVDAYVLAIVARHPEITTFVHTINSRPADTAIGDPGVPQRVLHGGGEIRERVLGLELCLSAGSFFQTNSAQASKLFEIVRAEAEPAGSELVYDLYCGTGTIALVLARDAREVIGFEIVASAVADARANAERNGIANVRFVEGDALAGLNSAGGPSPDVCVVDPPRAGLHKDVLAPLAALARRRIVYVSCHHPSAANDLAGLVVLGWRLVRAQPIDLFPHTPHVECVFTLERA